MNMTWRWWIEISFRKAMEHSREELWRIINYILRCFLSFVNITTVREHERNTCQKLLTCEYIQVSVLGLILGELRILHGVVPGFGLYELVFFTETDVPVDVKTRDMLNELLDGHGGPLAVLLAVFPFLKSGNIPRRIIQKIVGSVEAFPKNRSREKKHTHTHV